VRPHIISQAGLYATELVFPSPLTGVHGGLECRQVAKPECPTDRAQVAESPKKRAIRKGRPLAFGLSIVLNWVL
jgi:hypothetical protein